MLIHLLHLRQILFFILYIEFLAASSYILYSWSLSNISYKRDMIFSNDFLLYHKLDFIHRYIHTYIHFNPKENQSWIFFFFLHLFFISWRLITLQYCSGFCHTLEGLMPKMKLHNFGHLMRRTDLLEKTLILGKIEGRRRRGWQRMSW